jgi:predicted PurR-regulated permease PerM
MAAPTSFVARPARPAPRGGRRAPVARVPALLPVLILAGVALVVTVLAYARALLMPVALAALLAFLLGPIVATFERRIGRIAGVILVVVLASSVLGGLGWAVGSQAASLGEEIWRYRDNLKQKVADIRGAGRGGVIEKVQSTTEEVVEELEKEENPARPDKPVPVVVQPEPLWRLPRLLEALANVALVLILLIFMLLERHELRDRLIRLIGFARLTTTTRAMDEAGRRISHYLLRQTIINGTFGVGVAVGTLVMGLPYAFFWGCLSSVLRFIPYVGPWVSALLVCAFALAYFQGWMQPLLVVGLFVVLELFTNMVMETYLYSQSAGVSQVALLVAVAFWTWLWGAVGLALATPLTVCLAVLVKYVPELRLLPVLMTNEPVLT